MSSTDDAVNPQVNPWHPMTDPVDIKHIGKLLEELGEGVSAAARCLIQGIDEAEPVTGKPNRQWLEEELADVLAGIELTVNRWKLNEQGIQSRKDRKMAMLKTWHAMAGVTQ